MAIFIALIIFSLVTGVYLTYKLDIKLFFSERILHGTVISLSIFIQIIYLFTSGSGITNLKIFPILGLIFLFSIFSTYQLWKKFPFLENFKDSITPFKAN
jgi:hypothetical protein